MSKPRDSIPLRKLPSCYHTTGYAAVSTGPKP